MSTTWIVIAGKKKKQLRIRSAAPEYRYWFIKAIKGRKQGASKPCS
jgi:hypothetical protein